MEHVPCCYCGEPAFVLLSSRNPDDPNLPYCATCALVVIAWEVGHAIIAADQLPSWPGCSRTTHNDVPGVPVCKETRRTWPTRQQDQLAAAWVDHDQRGLSC